jgi:hypothetical protein
VLKSYAVLEQIAGHRLWNPDEQLNFLFGSNVKPKVDDVAVLDNIFLALKA